jgi:hypothetical protein
MKSRLGLRFFERPDKREAPAQPGTANVAAAEASTLPKSRRFILIAISGSKSAFPSQHHRTQAEQ